MNEINLSERKEEIEKYAEKVFTKIKGDSSKSKGMLVNISEIGTRNEITFLVKKQPLKKECHGRLMIHYPDYDILFEIEIHGFYGCDEAILAAVLILANALGVMALDILKYSLAEDSQLEMPDFGDYKNYRLLKILEDEIKNDTTKLLEKIANKQEEKK